MRKTQWESGRLSHPGLSEVGSFLATQQKQTSICSHISNRRISLTRQKSHLKKKNCHTKVAKLTLQLLDFPKQDFSSGLLFLYSGEQCHLVVTAIEQRRFTETQVTNFTQFSRNIKNNYLLTLNVSDLAGGALWCQEPCLVVAPLGPLGQQSGTSVGINVGCLFLQRIVWSGV